MMRSVLLLFSAFLIGICPIFGQEFKLGKLNRKDFEAHFEIKDTSASALILKRYRETYFDYDGAKGWLITTKVQERIKILKKNGLEYATHKVHAYKSGGKDEKLSNIEGYSYTVQDDKLRLDKLGSNAIFESEASENWDLYSWTMPNVKVGSIIEWQYTLTSPFYKIDDLQIQDDIPVLSYQAVIRAPDIFKFNRLKKGYFEVKPETEFKKRTTGVMVGQDTGYGLSNINSTSANLTMTEQIDTYTLKDIPALQEEAFVNNPENYRYTVVYELNAVHYSDGSIKKYASSWDDVSRSIFESDHFGKQLEKTAFMKEIVEMIKKMGTAPELLLENGFNFVRDNFTWNGDYGKYTKEDLNKTFKSHSGNVAEINLLLIALLRECGLEVNPILVSTQQHGTPIFPTLEGFNYVIAGVKIEDELVLLDATEKLSSPNILPLRVYNWEGRLIKKNGSSEPINLYPKTPSQQNFILKYEVKSDGVITGNMMRRYTNLEALDYRKRNKSNATDEMEQNLINELKIDAVENFEVKNSAQLNEPVIESYDFSLENAYDAVSNSIYISPLIFTRLIENPFKLEERQFPINFNYPFVITKSITIEIPKGYDVESIPESLNIALPENMGSFVYRTEVMKRTLNLNVQFSINEAVIPVGFHKALQDIYNRRLDKENEKIVFTKIQP